ncbi:MAG: csrA 1 [Phycisphaerales bacterium]|nr:csrA 1 [Phycisphaerales bacterium]
MLVMSRVRGESVAINGPVGDCLVTVLQVRGDTVSLLFSSTSTTTPGTLDAKTETLHRDVVVKIGAIVEVVIVDIRGEKARLGIIASKETSVHRLEVYDAIKRETRRAAGGDSDDGLAGSPVPRPGGPKPPSLDVRLNEPPPSEAP